MSEGSMFLVKFTDNWADEMDIDGYRIMTSKEKDSYLKFITEDISFPTEYTFAEYGTHCEYDSPEDLLSKLVFTPISPEQLDVIEKFGLMKQGYFPTKEALLM